MKHNPLDTFQFTAQQAADFAACASSKTDSRCRENATKDFLRHHQGVLSTQNLLATRERFLADGHPSYWIYLKKFASYLRTHHGLTTFPLRGIQPPPIQHRVRTQPTKEQWELLLKHSVGTAVHPLVAGLWMTGLAFSDICTLKWGDIDMDQLIIRKRRKKMTTRHKGACVIPLDPNGHFVQFLKERQPTAHLHKGHWPSTGDTLYVDNWLARQVLIGEAGDIYTAFKKVREAAGLPDIQVHDFRAATATELLRYLHPIQAIQITGHSNVSGIARYVQVREDVLVDGMRKLHEEMEAK